MGRVQEEGELDDQEDQRAFKRARKMGRKKENSMIKKIRDGMSEVKNELSKEQARVRSQRYHEKRKEQGLPINPTNKKLTRKAAEEKRQKDRERQRKYRENLTPQKKTWLNKKRREKRAAKKASADKVS